MMISELRTKDYKTVFMTILKSGAEMLAREYSCYAGQRVYDEEIEAASGETE